MSDKFYNYSRITQWPTDEDVKRFRIECEQEAFDTGNSDEVRIGIDLGIQAALKWLSDISDWNVGEPPEGVDNVLVKETEYETYTIMMRDSGEMWSRGVGCISWKKSFVWLPIPQ